MSNTLILVAAFLLAWALAGLLVRLFDDVTHKQSVNDRSMHKVATPVGGGLAIVAAFVAIVLAARGAATFDVLVILTGAVVLSAMSAIDHYRPLWPFTRIAIQSLIVAITLSNVPDTIRLAPMLPWLVERIGLAIAWLWLINLTNFMDGIDGLASAEGAVVAIGAALLFTFRLGMAGSIEVTLALALAGACIGFLVWNWRPARIFMGDAGSIPLGFLLGWLLLQLAINGAWAAALILPALFVADATLTLLRRLVRRESLWSPHRTHFYQRAVQGGTAPGEVVSFLTVCNIALVLLALSERGQPWSVIAGGAFITAVFLFFLSYRARSP